MPFTLDLAFPAAVAQLGVRCEHMKRFEAILSSTQVDLHGERMTKGALESAAAALRSHYVQMGVEHDPRHPPIGRFTEAWIEELPDGQAILKGAGELFEPGDALPESI